MLPPRPNAARYRVRDDGTKVPSWARDAAPMASSVAASQAAPATAPQKLGQDEAEAMQRAAANSGGSGAASYNRGYLERDMTAWCVQRLLDDVLAPMCFKLPDAEGTFRTHLPADLRGEALMAGVKGQWDHAFDFAFSVPFTAKVPARLRVSNKPHEQWLLAVARPVSFSHSMSH